MQAKPAHEILYKYREWTGIALPYTQALIRGQAYFATQPQLNDPFEFRWHLKRPETFERAVEFAAILTAQYFSHLKDSDAEYKFHWKKITDQIWGNPEPFYKMFRHIQQGVFCASRLNDDIRMWSHYGGQHSGVCVGFRARGFGRRFAEVKYAKDLPVFDGIDLFGPKAKVLEAAAIKSIDWDYEQEWRTFFRPGVKQLRKGTITEIILGCEMPSATRAEVIEFTKGVDPSIKLYEAVLSETQYKLIVRPIE